MKSQKILRTTLFVIFFGIGAVTLAGAVLSDDLLTYYQNKQLLKDSESSVDKLQSLNSDYDVLLGQLQKDPNLLKRIAPALGAEDKKTDAVNPRLSADQLAVARAALAEQSPPDTDTAEIPRWLTRSCEPRRRIVLFIAGAFLIIISFVWFGSAKLPDQEK